MKYKKRIIIIISENENSEHVQPKNMKMGLTSYIERLV